jgi:hypothetical protein
LRWRRTSNPQGGGFDVTVDRFNWQRLVAHRSAYIERIHASYEKVLGKNQVDVIPTKHPQPCRMKLVCAGPEEKRLRIFLP